MDEETLYKDIYKQYLSNHTPPSPTTTIAATATTAKTVKTATTATAATTRPNQHVASTLSSQGTHLAEKVGIGLAIFAVQLLQKDTFTLVQELPLISSISLREVTSIVDGLTLLRGGKDEEGGGDEQPQEQGQGQGGRV